MDILYVCKSLPQSYKGGIQTHVWELSKHMINLGNKVFILTGGSLRYKIENVNGRIIYKLPYIAGRKLPFLPQFIDQLSFNLAAYWWLKKHNHFYDIIHLHGRSGFFFPYWAKKKRLTNLILTNHSLTYREFLERMKINKFSIDEFLMAKMVRYYEKFNYSAVAKVIAVSQVAKEQVLKETECKQENISIIPNGIDPDTSGLIQNVWTKYKYFTFVGRLVDLKGVQHLPEAASSVAEDIKFVLIGDGPLKKKLLNEIKKRKLGDKFIFTGSLEKEEITHWLNRSYAVIHPSYYETQGIAVLEASNLGKPVIVSQLEAFKNTIIDGVNGVYLDEISGSEIAKKVNNLAKIPSRALNMGELGRRWVSDNYSWKNIADRTQSLYLEMVSGVLNYD